MIKEQDIQRAILDWLTAKQCVHWRCNLQGARVAGGRRIKNPMKGFPDIAGVLPDNSGRMFVIEVKRPGGVLSADQQKWRQVLEERGVIYILAYSIMDVQLAIMQRLHVE